MMTHSVLVSGATGFIASHAIERLLAQGHMVKGTVRDPKATDKNAHLLAMPGAKERLTLVAADLNDADPFSAHVMDVDTIMHMASPYVINVADAQRDLVDPAVNGTVSMLKAAAKSKTVKRVVLTSSMAAITDEPDGRVLTEADWNTQSSLTRNPYYFSKTLAERAAWDFMTNETKSGEKPAFDLVVINPFLVVGPSHTNAINSSNQILVDVIKGQYPAILALDWGFVDVRDVADAHIAVMDHPKAEGRYVTASANMDMVQLVALMKEVGFGHTKLPKINLTGSFGTGLMKLVSYTQPQGVGSYLRTHLGRVPRFDNSKSRRDLGLNYRTPEASIRDTLVDLAKWGHIPKPVL
jgi:dihydroflavonol-4-reductase